MARKKNIAAGQNAVIYARYSSHNQREVSIEQQVRECMKHAAELGLHVVGTYEDRAISGKTDKRPNFQRMMRDAEKGKFQAVVAWKSNRIGRNMLQAMVNEAKLEDCGVKVFYAEEDFDDTAAGRFALRNMMNVNQFYSENMAEDITRGLYDNASKCMANGRQPLGYKRGEDGRVVLDEANAAVVREIFTRVAAGDLFVDIARDLNAQGIKTSKGANWNKGSFQSICQNERYRGIYIYGDVRVADGIPRIVSDDLWYRVQEAMRMKKNPVGTRHRVGAEDYLLTGKLRCGHCGSYMTGVSGTSRNGELHYYYTCQKRRTEHACDKKNIRRDVIEPAVAQAIKMYCLTDDVIAWIADRTVEYWEKHDNDLQIEALEQQLEENKKATSNMLKAIEMGIITEATRTRMVELETEQSRLSVQLNAAKEDVVKIDREQIISYLELLQQGDIHDRDFQMELFKNFLVAVYVYDDNRMKLVFSCMGDQNSVEIPLETGEDPPDGGLSLDAKMFVLTPDSSTKKPLHNVRAVVFFFSPSCEQHPHLRRWGCCWFFFIGKFPTEPRKRSDERVIEPPEAEGHGQAEQQQRSAQPQRDEIAADEGALGVPCALALFAKAPQLHGVGDGVDAVQAGQDQGQQDVYGIFEPFEERFLLAQLHAAGLLGLTDAVVVPLDVRDIPQRYGHRVAHLIRDADAVQAGRKLAGVGGRDEEDGHRQGHEILQRDVAHIEQLLRRQVIPPEQVAEHRAGAVEGRALIGVEQKDEEVVQQQEHQHEDQHEPHFAEFDPAQLERRQADRQQHQQHIGVVGDHAGKGKQQEKRQLGGARQLMDDTFPREIIQHRFSGHFLAPPCPAR